MKKEKSFRVFVLYALLLQFLILISQTATIEQASKVTLKNYITREATVQVLVSYSSIFDSESAIHLAYTGTGTVIAAKNNDLYVLTVKHVCVPMQEDQVSSFGITQTVEIQDSSGEYHVGQIALLSNDEDLCVIKYRTENPYSTIPATLAPNPAYLDERVFMYAAPSGFYVPTAITQFEGISAGNAVLNGSESAVYTIPATGGSSGAAITNSDGMIVGVLHSTLADFHHISLSTTYDATISFIEDLEIQEQISILD